MADKLPDAVPENFKVPYTWLDGELVPSEQAVVPVMAYTLHYGLGVFEGIRAYDGKGGPAVFKLVEHIERLVRSARLVRMTIPFSVEQMVHGCLEAMSKNKLRQGYLRPLAFVDDGKRGLGAMNNRVRVAVAVWPWGAYLGEEGLNRGIRAQIASVVRMSARSFLPKGKISGQYVNSIMAKRLALLAGYDEAILLDEEGYVAEASGENIFIVKDGVLYTPPKSAPILVGITRATVIDLATTMGLEVREEGFGRDTLFQADEVFFTGTAAEVTPVREVDGHVIGAGARGPITTRIQSAYFVAVNGRIAGREGWLSPYTVA